MMILSAEVAAIAPWRYAAARASFIFTRDRSPVQGRFFATFHRSTLARRHAADIRARQRWRFKDIHAGRRRGSACRDRRLSPTISLWY
jgi:hypothetical protein